MIQVIKFQPTDITKAGLKEDIFFRITELAPFDPALALSNPPRLASKLEGEGTFRRLAAKELQQKAQSNSALYVDVGLNPAATIINGDAGLVPATQAQIQDELEKATVAITAKNKELSSLVVLRRKQDPAAAAQIGASTNAFLADTIEFCTKGAVNKVDASGQVVTVPGVLEIRDQQQGLPYLFLSRPKESRVNRVLEKDLIEVATPSVFVGEQHLALMSTDTSELPSTVPQIYYFEIDKVINPSIIPITISVIAVPAASVLGKVECVVSGSSSTNIIVAFRFNKSNPPTASEMLAAFSGSSATDYLNAKLASTSGDGLIASPTATPGEQSIFSGAVGESLTTTFPGANNDLVFTKKPATVKVKPTAFSKAAADGSLFSADAQLAVKQTALFRAVPGIPLLRNAKVGADIPTLEEYCALIEQEIPLTAIFAPVTTQQGPIGNFLGNLDISSLSVGLYDDDTTVMLVQNGEAQPGASVQYRLHKEPNLAEEIEIGNVDVTIKLSSPPARVPIRGQLVRGAQEIALAVKIATSPGRLTPLGSGDAQSNISSSSLLNTATFGAASSLDKAQDKVGEAVKRFSESQVPGEYYFNFQAKNAQGQAIDLNKYGTIRLFDEVTFVYLDSAGKLITLQKTSIVGVIDSNNTIVIKEPITALPPPGSTVLVQIPQTPLNPGRKYRVVVSCVDKEG